MGCPPPQQIQSATAKKVCFFWPVLAQIGDKKSKKQNVKSSRLYINFWYFHFHCYTLTSQKTKSMIKKTRKSKEQHTHRKKQTFSSNLENIFPYIKNKQKILEYRNLHDIFYIYTDKILQHFSQRIIVFYLKNQTL